MSFLISGRPMPPDWDVNGQAITCKDGDGHDVCQYCSKLFAKEPVQFLDQGRKSCSASECLFMFKDAADQGVSNPCDCLWWVSYLTPCCSIVVRCTPAHCLYADQSSREPLLPKVNDTRSKSSPDPKGSQIMELRVDEIRRPLARTRSNGVIPLHYGEGNAGWLVLCDWSAEWVTDRSLQIPRKCNC